MTSIHLNYETAQPYQLDELAVEDLEVSHLRVQKMAFGRSPDKSKNRSRIIFNPRITLAGIPGDAFRYRLGSRSAIEWIVERFQIKTDQKSGIINDPNDWAAEHDEPRYIIDLLKRIVTVSVETMKIVDNLPPLDIIEPGGGRA